MRKEYLIKRDKNTQAELHCVDSHAGSLSSQVVEMKAIDKTSSVEGIDDQASKIEDGSSDSSYILNLITSLGKQEKELTITQTEIQTLLVESDELLAEYKVSVKVMKEKLSDRIIKLRMPKV